MNDKEPTDEATYSIGAVARLTGIPVDTVRMWERRYDVVQPQRNVGNKRRYAAADVARLTLIKRLVDQGNPISTIAALSEQNLRDRLSLHEDARERSSSQRTTWRVLLFGDTLKAAADEDGEQLRNLQLEGSFTSWPDFERTALDVRCEVMVCEFPALNIDHANRVLELVRRVSNPVTVVLYGYATSSVLARLERRGKIRLLRSPATLTAIESVALAPADDAVSAKTLSHPGSAESFVVGLPLETQLGNVKPRQFDDQKLAQAARIATSVRCECPRHLADLLYRLCAFEAYSLDCESRNEKDQAIHAYLYHATAHARSTIEAALAHLIKLEGIDLDVDA